MMPMPTLKHAEAAVQAGVQAKMPSRDERTRHDAARRY